MPVELCVMRHFDQALLQMLLKGDIESFSRKPAKLPAPAAPGNDLDYILMQDPAFRAYCIANFTQSARQGLDAWADELKSRAFRMGL